MPAAVPNSLALAVNTLLRRSPHVNLTIAHSWGAPKDFAAVRDGDLDALILVGPVDFPGLQTSTLVLRERYAVLPADHPLARQPVLRLEDIIDLPTFRRPDDVLPSWRSYWLNLEERGHEPTYHGRSHCELDALLAIASGRVIGLAPDGWGHRPGLATRLVTDLPPVPILLVTRPEQPAPMLRTFVDTLQHQARQELTLTERRVATLVAHGYTDHQIADLLVLSPRTIESHVANARQRLGLRSRAHLAAHITEQATTHPTAPPNPTSPATDGAAP